jgi:hypothetical protein
MFTAWWWSTWTVNEFTVCCIKKERSYTFFGENLLDYEEFYLLGCDSLYSDRRLLIFWRIILPPPSGSKSKAFLRNVGELLLEYTASYHNHRRENLKSHGVWFDFISDLLRTLVNNVGTYTSIQWRGHANRQPTSHHSTQPFLADSCSANR